MNRDIPSVFTTVTGVGLYLFVCVCFILTFIRITMIVFRIYEHLNFGVDIMDTASLEQLRGLANVISVCSRTPQIISNFRTKSTGSLSLLTLTLMLGGNLARVFTTIAEASNYNGTVLVGYIASLLTNCILVIQIVHYWPRGEENKSKHQ